MANGACPLPIKIAHAVGLRKVLAVGAGVRHLRADGIGVPGPEQGVRAAGQLGGQPPEQLAAQQHEACGAAASCSVEGQLQPRRGGFHRRPKVGGPCNQSLGLLNGQGAALSRQRSRVQVPSVRLRLWVLVGPATNLWLPTSTGVTIGVMIRQLAAFGPWNRTKLGDTPTLRSSQNRRHVQGWVVCARGHARLLGSKWQSRGLMEARYQQMSRSLSCSDHR